MSGLRRILAVRTDRLGDVTLTLPACVELKNAHPGAEVLFLCRDYAKPLAERCEAVDGVVLYEPGGAHRGLGGAIRLAGELRALKIDAAFLFYPRPLLALALFLAGIQVRVGTARRWYSFFLNHRVALKRREGGKHEAECNLELARDFIPAIPAPQKVVFRLSLRDADKEEAASSLTESGVAAPYAVIHPGSGGSAPGLPPEMFAKIALELASKYALRVVIAGTAAEAGLVREVVEEAGPNPAITPLTGLTLPAYAALIAGAKFFTANSTGPLHIARALEIPVLGFYCSATALAPDRWGPYNRPLSALTPHIPPCPKCDRGSCGYVNCLELLEWREISARMAEIIGD